MSRVIPLTGTELQRQAVAQFIRDMEIHTTSDQRRLFIQNMCVAPVWHGEVSSEQEMTDLRWDVQRGCWPGDMVRRIDLFGAVYVCVSRNGNTLADWVILVPGDQGTNTGDTSTSSSSSDTGDTGGGGFQNPMTEYGDIIIGDTGGVAQRLAAGPEGYILAIVAGVPAWVEDTGGESGGGDPIEPCAVRIERTTTQSIPDGTDTFITWTNPAVYDKRGPFFNSADPTKLTAPVTGIYTIAASVVFAANATGVRYIQIRKNNSVSLDFRYLAAVNGSPTVVDGYIEVALSAGDYIQLRVYHTRGVALNITDSEGNTCMTMSLKEGSAGGSGATKMFNIGREATQTISNTTVTTVSFDTQLWDEEDLWVSGDPTKITMTAKAAGRWGIHAMARFDSNTTGMRNLYLKLNGNTVHTAGQTSTNGDDCTVELYWPITLVATDVLTLHVWQNSGGNRTIISKISGELLNSLGGGRDSSFISTATGTQNDFVFNDANTLFMNNATLATINGLRAGVDGQRLLIVSKGAGQVDIANQAGASVAANRIINQVTGTISLAPGLGSVMLAYDITSARWRVVAHEQGAPISVTFNAAHYTGSGTITWTVASGDVFRFDYFLRGKMLTVSNYLGTTTVSGTGAELRVAIPGGFVAATLSIVANFGSNNGTQYAGFAQAAAAATYIQCFTNVGGTAWAASTDNTSSFVTITFPVQ